MVYRKKIMSNKSVSPTAVIWKRLQKNKPAMVGLLVIAFASVISLFCYVFIPDNTPHANEMNLSLSTLKPGSTITVLKVPAQVPIEHQNFLIRVFEGTPSGYKNIPLDTFWFSNDKMFIREFTGDAEIISDTVVMSLASLYSGSGNYTLNGEHVLFNDDEKTFSLTLSDIRKEILDNRIEKRTFLLGTDRFGRDLFSRIMSGTRVSMAVGLIAVIISLIIGIALGSLAGFFRGRVDDIIMWLINVVWSIPTLLLVIAITMALGKGFAQVFVAVGLTMWVEVARVVRGQIFSLREMEFVEAGRALGYTNSRIILKHILPNILSPVIVIAASNFASAILLEAGLSFLGMGAQPPTPSWGMMIKENYGYIIVDAAYLAVYPGLAIMIMVLAFTWLGNGLRDAIDAKEGMGSRV